MSKPEPDHRPLAEAVRDISKKTPDQIADIMREWDVKGRPGTTHLCPLAKIMGSIYGGEYIVGQEYIARRSGKSIEKLPTPKNCALFIRKFDRGEYSDLIAPPPRVLGQTRVRNTSGKKRKRGEKVNHPAREVGRFEE